MPVSISKFKQSLAFLIAAFCFTPLLSAETTFTPADLGVVPIGALPAGSTLTFSLNDQSVAPAFSLLYGSEFALGTASCDAGFTSCTVPVTFTPKYPGLRRDLVVVRDSASNLIGRMILTGTGKGPQASVSPGTTTTFRINIGGLTKPGTTFAIDPAGNIYTILYSSNQVVKINAVDGSATVVMAGIPLNNPASLAIDPAGNLYIADSGNNVIRKVDAVTGTVTTVVGNGTQSYSGDGGPAISAEITRPYSLVFDSAGNLYFLEGGTYSDLSDYKVHKVDFATQTITVFAGTGVAGNTGDNGPATQAQIAPLGLGVDLNDNVLIAQQGQAYTFSADSVRVVSGGVISKFAGSSSGTANDGAPALSTSFYYIRDISFDAAGNTYFIDGATCCIAIRKLSASAPHVVSTVFRSDSIAVNYLIGSLAVDSAGNFYVSDNFTAAMKISTDGAPLKLPSTNAGSTSSSQQLLYYNTGNDTLNIADISITGVNPGDFAQTNNCGTSLPAGGSCAISVAFTPQAMGSRNALLTITDNARTSPRNVALSGTGLTPQQAVLSLSSLDFGQQTAGTPSAPKTITLSNPGVAALGIASITTSDPSFTATSDCGSSLAAASQCTISVTFSPRLNGFTGPASLFVTDDASNSPQGVGLRGFGVGANSAASVSFSSLNLGLVTISDFGARQIKLSNQQAITVTSTGTGNLGGIYYNLSGANSSDFSVYSPCGGPTAPGASCNLMVTFTPSASGVRTATLQIGAYASNGAGAPAGLPQTVTLIGTGFLQTNSIRGGSGYLRVSADFDGDGKADLAYWRPADGTWRILPSSNSASPIIQQWGLTGDIPIPGDYDGDGKADLAVWRPANGTWYILPSSHPSTPVIQQWGLPGDIPMIGDFDADSKADLAIWRQSTGTWYVAPSRNPNTPIVQQWGLPADIPLTGDFDGDGKADFTVWRPSTGNWHILPSSNSSVPITQQWGLRGDTPVAVDFDGDGKTDLAIWRPLTGAWWIIPSGNPSSSATQQWGPNR